MFVVMSIYRAKAGEEDAIIAMYENCHFSQHIKALSSFSWMLLRKVDAPYDFIDIAHFENEELALAMKTTLNQDAWYSRLISLMEEAPISTSCRCEWCGAGILSAGNPQKLAVLSFCDKTLQSAKDCSC